MAVSAVFMGSMCFRKANVSVRTNATAASEPLFLRSQFLGTAISFQQPISAPSMLTTTLKPIVARRVCPFTGKKTNKANNVSFSNHKTRKLQFVNLQYKRIWWEGGKRWLKLRLSTKAIKTIEKNGLEAVAKKAGIELKKIR